MSKSPSWLPASPEAMSTPSNSPEPAESSSGQPASQPTAVRPVAGGINCQRAFILTREFTSGEIEKPELRKLRSHMAFCGECRQTYREAVETTASLSRFAVEAREQRQIERQRNALHAKVYGEKEKPKRRRFPFRLRLILMPAFFIYLVTQITQLGPPPARVELIGTEGTVHLHGKPIESEVDRLLILPGRWISTMPLAKATLDGRECLFSLGSETEVLLEAARPVRVRVKRGYVKFDGDAVVVTAMGMLDIKAGKGSLHLSDAGLRLEPESGEWTFVDRRGKRTVPNGEMTLLRP